MKHLVKKTNQITEVERSKILNAWSIEEWKDLTDKEFSEIFKTSEWHLLYDDEVFVAVVRVNTKFSFNIGENEYNVSEMVGLAALEKGKGYGKEIVLRLIESLKDRNIECIGFCYEHNRGFYEKCGVEVLTGLAKFFLEKHGDECVLSDDDDVINVTLTEKLRSEIFKLSYESPAYIV